MRGLAYRRHKFQRTLRKALRIVKQKRLYPCKEDAEEELMHARKIANNRKPCTCSWCTLNRKEDGLPIQEKRLTDERDYSKIEVTQVIAEENRLFTNAVQEAYDKALKGTNRKTEQRTHQEEKEDIEDKT